VDDEARYPLPVLTPPELSIALGKRSWDDYILDEIG
jgi:2-(3-amino-3-carboxypropyl)histidine synthase